MYYLVIHAMYVYVPHLPVRTHFIPWLWLIFTHAQEFLSAVSNYVLALQTMQVKDWLGYAAGHR